MGMLHGPIHGSGGNLAGSAIGKKRAIAPGIVVTLCVCIAATMGFALFIGLGTASGAAKDDDSTLGIGSDRSTRSDTDSAFDAAQKLAVAVSSDSDISSVSDTRATKDGAAVQRSASDSLKTTAVRTISVKDPDPVLVLSAVDMDDENTVATAALIGAIDPLPTAPRLQPDTSGEGWMVGQASGYDVASSSTLTRSGRSFDDDCVTVAVPQGQEDLLGHAVEIVYGDKTVVATVTDTGGFAKYGRALDLAGGVFKALGASDTAAWGVRTVSYRFL